MTRGQAQSNAMPNPPPDTLPAPPAHRPLPTVLRWLLQAFAVLCLIVGIIGIITPGCQPPSSS